MSEDTTARLENILKTVEGGADATQFAEKHAKPVRFFYQYANEFIAAKGLELPEVIVRSGISKNYIYNILNGDTKNPGRDKIIALCVGMGMDIDELNRGLKIAGHNALYPKNERDIHIAAQINKKINSVTELNIKLVEQGQEPLEV